jgi:hypothetical protein
MTWPFAGLVRRRSAVIFGLARRHCWRRAAALFPSYRFPFLCRTFRNTYCTGSVAAPLVSAGSAGQKFDPRPGLDEHGPVNRAQQRRTNPFGPVFDHFYSPTSPMHRTRSARHTSPAKCRRGKADHSALVCKGWLTMRGRITAPCPTIVCLRNQSRSSRLTTYSAVHGAWNVALPTICRRTEPGSTVQLVRSNAGLADIAGNKQKINHF